VVFPKKARGVSIGTMRAAWIGLGLGVALVACGGGNGGATHVEISGKTPTEAAAIAARAVCMRDARCGHPSITCMGGGAAGGSGSDASPPTTSCVATIAPVAYDRCYTDASGDIATLLSCAALTAEQIDMLEICFDTLAATACITQEQADAQARASEAGTSPPPNDLPAACALLEHPPTGC
jgi:hypothetical protein